MENDVAGSGADTLAEETALGGQTGTSSQIENVLGFAAGKSGEELAARAALQSQKFGVRIKLAARAVASSTRSWSRPAARSTSATPTVPGLDSTSIAVDVTDITDVALS